MRAEAVGQVPEYVHDIEADVATSHIVGSALEDGREAGDSRPELQKRITAYLRATGRLRAREAYDARVGSDG